MNAIEQRVRPKHQVLVLKCYPRTTKGAVDVKPNSSELSYLLFYASSRRSKIQKIGAFLEKKTASDVWRMRIGYVFFAFLPFFFVCRLSNCIARFCDIQLPTDPTSLSTNS